MYELHSIRRINNKFAVSSINTRTGDIEYDDIFIVSTNSIYDVILKLRKANFIIDSSTILLITNTLGFNMNVSEYLILKYYS